MAIDVRYFFPRTAFERSPVIAAAFVELLRGRNGQEVLAGIPGNIIRGVVRALLYEVASWSLFARPDIEHGDVED